MALACAAPDALAQPLRRALLPQDQLLFDPLLRSTADADLLSPRQAMLRNHLRGLGVDPAGPRQSPTLQTLLEAQFAQRSQWDRWGPQRSRREWIFDFERKVVVEIVIPEIALFGDYADTNLVGVAFKPPRDFADEALELRMDGLDAFIRSNVSIGLQQQWTRQLRNRQDSGAGTGALLNFTIPIRLPRTLERIIGRGDATNIRISGTETITIGGQSTRRSDFVASEIRQSQSLFPQLELEQQLRVNLDGQVGEKIKVRVSHDSQRIGSESTEVKLAFEGDEDDIIQVIRAGDIDVTLPGSQLLGLGASRGGLFGLKVQGAVGPVDFTLLTSKEQATQGSQSFSQRGGSAEEREVIIRDVDYVRGRFFRLAAPFSLFFPGEGFPVDGSLAFLQGVAFEDNPWKIDPSSIQVYTPAVFVGTGADNNIVDAGIAVLDDTGLGWEGFGDGDILPGGLIAGQPREGASDEELAAYLDATYTDPRRYEFATRWRRLVLDVDFDVLLDFDTGALVGLQMSRSYGTNDVIAVSYDIVDATGTTRMRKVGRSIEDQDGPRLPSPGNRFGTDDDIDEVFFFKLLKPRNQQSPRLAEPDPITGDPFEPLALTWEYELRNFYDLRGREIDAASFDLRIRRNLASLEVRDRQPETNVPWIRVFGLDQFDREGNLEFDDLADVEQGAVVDLANGILQFPVSTPFSMSDALVDSFTRGTADPLGDELKAPALYKEVLNTTQRSELNRFEIVVQQAGVSSRLQLNAFNIREGSEEVVFNGRTLQRGVDYDIDYFSGEVNLKGDALAQLNAQSNIRIRFEQDSLFGGGRTSLSGINLSMKLGKQNQLSTTWLFQSRPNSQTKVRLGEEPKRALVGNLSTKFRVQPEWFEGVAAFISRANVDKPPTFNINAEAAISIPNPNTKDIAYLEDFENVDQSSLITLSREGWWWSSLPVRGKDVRSLPDSVAVDDLPLRDALLPENRVYTGWHRAIPGLEQGWINPTLTEQEKRDVLPTLELRMVASDPVNGWDPDEFGGIMRSVGELDLSQSQFLEFWVDDGSGYVDPNADQATFDLRRPGTLHFDFGILNEDFFWKRTDEDTFELGRWDLEDNDNDGILGSPPGYGSEDRGLDGVLSENEPPLPVIVGRAGRAGDPAGDDFDAESGDGNVFVYINGTEDNNRLDSEDINRDGFHELSDGFFRVSLDLSDSDPLVDIYRDFAGDAAFIEDSRSDLDFGPNGRSWRRYRLELRNLPILGRGDDDNEVGGYVRAVPDLSRVRSFRVWYEPDAAGPEFEPAERRIRFADMQFLGNRWISDQIRDDYDEIVLPTDRPAGQDFRLGVLNNKENPDYIPPISVEVRNSVPELEQALQFEYTELTPGARFRARKELPGRNGENYLNYGKFNFFWRVPYVSGVADSDQIDALEGFYWVGSDSLNYYEITIPFGSSTVRADDWVEVTIDLADLSSVKSADETDLVAFPDTSSTRINPLVRRGFARDTLSGDDYPIVVRGRPDLQRVQRFYAGVRYRKTSPTHSAPAFSGSVLFNELRLREVNREIGYAQRYSLNAQIPGVGDFTFDYRSDDAEFRGLSQDLGSGISRQSWSGRASSKLQNWIPTFGFDIPFSVQRRTSLELPKYEPRSDRELTDPAEQEEFRSENTSESFSFQVRKTRQSSNPLLKYTLDRLNYSLNGSRTTRTSPTSESSQKSASQKYNYDLRLRDALSLPLPFTKAKLGLLPTQITLNSAWNYDEQFVVEKRLETGERIERAPRFTKTSVNNANFTLAPLKSLRGTMQLSSGRNLLLGDPVEILGINFGTEETFSQRMSFQYKPEFRWLTWTRPNIDFNAGYSENRRPGIRRRASSEVASDPRISPDGDGAIGAAGQVRSVSNSNDINVRSDVDLKNLLGKTTGRIRGVAKWFGGRFKRGGSDSGGGPASADSSAAQTADALRPGATRPDDSLALGRQEALRRVEERREREEALRAAQFAAANDTTGTAAVADSSSFSAAADSVEREGISIPRIDIRVLARKSTAPFISFYKNLKPISTNWQRQRTSNYQNIADRAGLSYRLGLADRPDFDALGGVPVRIDPDTGELVEEHFSSESRSTSQTLRLNGQSQISTTVRVDGTYTLRTSQNEGARGLTRDRSVEWPNVNLKISRVNEWGVWKRLGNPFQSSNLDLAYKRNESRRGETELRPVEPRITTAWSPRWSFRLHNGLDSSLNLTLSSEETANLTHRQVTGNTRANLRVSQQFDAEGRLKFLRFGQKGTGANIDMNVNMSYNRQRQHREEKDDPDKRDQERGSDRISVSPQFSYQFSRNLRAGLKLDFSYNKILQTAATSITVGLFFDATLNF